MPKENVHKLLTSELSTPGDHLKKNCFKQSIFWSNLLNIRLNQDELKMVVQQSLLERYREDGHYDQVTRNPGIFANDVTNGFLKRLNFPSKQFYNWMKSPDIYDKEISEYIQNIPDDVIDIYVKWYHEFITREEGDLSHKPQEFKDKQFFALAAFGALTWRTNEFITDQNLAKNVKKNIIEYKNRQDKPFEPFMQRLREKQLAYAASLQQNPDEAELDKSVEQKVAKITSDPTQIQQTQNIMAFNDPMYDLINSIKYDFQHAGYNVEADFLTKLNDKLVGQRQTGKKINNYHVMEVLVFLDDNIRDIIDDPNLQNVYLKCIEFKNNPVYAKILQEHDFTNTLNDHLHEVEQNNSHLIANFDYFVGQLQDRIRHASKENIIDSSNMSSPESSDSESVPSPPPVKKRRTFGSKIKHLKDTSASHKQRKLDVLMDIREECQKMAGQGLLINFDKIYDELKKQDPSRFKVIEDMRAKGTKSFIKQMKIESDHVVESFNSKKPRSI